MAKECVFYALKLAREEYEKQSPFGKFLTRASTFFLKPFESTGLSLSRMAGITKENKTAAEDYKGEIKEYCTKHTCPNNGKIIDDGMPNGAGTIPKECWFGITAKRIEANTEYTPIP